MPPKRKWNPIENLLGYTNLHERRRKVGKKRKENNDILEENENVGSYCNLIFGHFTIR
jgi:hypothetical protein